MKEEVKELKIKMSPEEFIKVSRFDDEEIGLYLATNYGILPKNIITVTTIAEGTLSPVLNIKYKEIQWDPIKVK